MSTGDIALADSDTVCNFMLLTDSDFAAFKSGRSFNYLGGLFDRFPAKIRVPHSGNWNAVVSPAGTNAIRASIGLFKGK